MKYCTACKTSYPTDFQVCPKDGTVLSQTTELLPGLIIREKYQILEKIGVGGMATVYRARHLDFNEIFAIKLINQQFVDDGNFIKRLRAEAVIARKLRHPHAVRIEDLDRTEDGRLFIVMEHVDGQDLRRLIRKTGALPASRVLGIASQVCSALSAAHALGIVHRDIKPDNIQLLATPDGTDFVKVLDFGIAKLRRTAANDESLTGSGLLLGTPQYLSPEQAMGKTGTHLDGRSDLYSLGILVYEMLTGRVPFESDTPMGLLVHHLHTLPPPPHQVRPDLDIPQPVSELLMHALQKLPEERFQSADEMLAAIQSVEAQLQAPPVVPAPADRPAAPRAGVDEAAPAFTPPALFTPSPTATPPPALAAQPAGVPQTHHELMMAAYEGERPFPWRIAAVLAAMLVAGIVAGAIYSHYWGAGKNNAQPTRAAQPPSGPHRGRGCAHGKDLCGRPRGRQSFRAAGCHFPSGSRTRGVGRDPGGHS
jgi:tRNA A-37 threonylcarbamoyl transferase component Bud32